MLSREDNELITHVGPGTPMGDVLRRYWLPALLVSDLPAPDCPPVRVKLLGEELVAFRDTQGRVGLLDEYCPHRLTSLFLGRNEECGLRCVYHGWKFDVAGNCVDMPTEPAGSRFHDKIKVLSYPTIELGGVIWAYFGPAQRQPAPPGMEWARSAENRHFVSRTVEYCNYLQAVEGGIDTAHSSYLHNNDLAHQGLRQLDGAPRLEVQVTDYGFRYASIRDAGQLGNYVRIYQFVMPFHQLRASRFTLSGTEGHEHTVPTINGHMWVPMDDENTMIFNWMFATDPSRALTPERIQQAEAAAGRGPDGETGDVRRRSRANNWLIDREVQRTKTFTGIQGVNCQDLAVQEAMGRIVPRWREHLGSTDLAVIAMRRLFLDAVQQVREGSDPPGVNPESYRSVRAAEAILPKDAAWQEAARELLVAAA